MYLLKAKNSEIRKYPLCLGNISGEFLANNMRNRTKWVCVQFFCWLESFWYSQTYNGKTWYKIIFGLIKKMFIRLLTSLVVTASSYTKCVSLSNQKREIQPTFINWHPNEYSQEFHYYPFTITLDKFVGICNTLNDLSNKVCVPNKTKDLNLSVFNIITGINESKTLTKHISCECKCKFDEKKCNSKQ